MSQPTTGTPGPMSTSDDPSRSSEESLQDSTHASTHARRRPRHRGRRSLFTLVLAALLVIGLVVAGYLGIRALSARNAASTRLLGDARSGLSWHSGAFPGGDWTVARADAFGAWRGAPVDVVIMYSERATYDKIAGSKWHVDQYRDFDGTLAYGLPLIPDDTSGTFASVAAGQQDWVWTKIAQDLVDGGHPNAIIRIGWEANGDWWKWATTAQTAEGYRSAYRRVVEVMRKVSGDFVFDFDIACGEGLQGQSDRLDALTKLYPGDDVVDVVGCDLYDWYYTKATDDATWTAGLRPAESPGLADIADFARAHGKGLSVPEWGVTKTGTGGVGDNPLFIAKMHEFFEQNKDILAFEAYFNEKDAYIESAIWDSTLNPKSGEEYAKLWSRR